MLGRPNEWSVLPLRGTANCFPCAQHLPATVALDEAVAVGTIRVGGPCLVADTIKWNPAVFGDIVPTCSAWRRPQWRATALVPIERQRNDGANSVPFCPYGSTQRVQKRLSSVHEIPCRCR
jgi:hypothetical protein